MVDIFEEVEEDLRSERYKYLAARLLPWIIGGLIVGVLLVGGGIGYQKYRQNQTNFASQSYAKALETLQAGDAEAAYRQFGAIEGGAKGYRTLALMQQAGIRFDENKPKEAIALLDQAAEAAPGGRVGQVLGDAARLKAAFAAMDQAPLNEVEARLKPLTEDGRPYRTQAREALAMARINAGQVAEARKELVVLSLMNDAPQSLRDRARNTVSMIDSGLLASVPAVVKAAAALPPIATMPPEMMLPPGIQGVPAQQGTAQ